MAQNLWMTVIVGLHSDDDQASLDDNDAAYTELRDKLYSTTVETPTTDAGPGSEYSVMSVREAV